MSEPERVYVTDGKLTVNLDDFGCLPCVALVLLVWSIMCSGQWVSNAIDRNTAAMEAPACVPIEVEPLQPPAILENR